VESYVLGSTVAAASVPTAAVEAAGTVESATAVGTKSSVEITQALPAQLSGPMRLFVLGRRPAKVGPAPAPGVFLPVALAVATVHVAVATRIHVAAAQAPSSDVPVIDEVIPRDANMVAPVVVHVHVTDAVMPAPAAAAVPPPAVMPDASPSRG